MHDELADALLTHLTPAQAEREIGDIIARASAAGHGGAIVTQQVRLAITKAEARAEQEAARAARRQREQDQRRREREERWARGVFRPQEWWGLLTDEQRHEAKQQALDQLADGDSRRRRLESSNERIYAGIIQDQYSRGKISVKPNGHNPVLAGA